jgi:hypothetical protein
MQKLDKARMRERGRQLRALLNEWDPIGVGPDAPKDEYDCLLWPVMGKLEAGASEEQLVAFLVSELKGHFGLTGDAGSVKEFVWRARNWFEASWKGTRV